MVRVLIVAWLVAIAGSAPSSAGPQEEIAAQLTTWSEAFAAGNTKAISDVYAPDARLWGTLAKAQDIGVDAITKYFEAIFTSLPTRQVVIGDHAIRPYGTAAVASGAMEVQFTRKDGTTGTLPVRFSMAFVRNGDKWQIVDHHSSPLQK